MVSISMALFTDYINWEADVLARAGYTCDGGHGGAIMVLERINWGDSMR